MSKLRLDLLLAIAIALLACGCRKKQDFPGYTYVGSDGANSGFVDLSSVKSNEEGVTFSFISQRTTGEYSILTVFSDCSNGFRRMGGTTYTTDGVVAGNVPAEAQPSLLSTNAAVKAAASAACGNPIVSRSAGSDKFDSANALRAIFGNYDPQSRAATWDNIEVPNDPNLSDLGGVSQGVVTVAFDGAFRESGIDKHFVITSTKPTGESYDCHICLPLLGAAVFSRKGSNWNLDSESRYLIAGAGFGKKPRCQLVQYGSDKYGVMMHYSDMAQGFETEWIVLIGSEGGGIKPIFTLTTRQDPNDALCQHAPPNDKSCTRYTVDYRFMARPDAKYFDVVTTKTVRSREGDVSSTETFSLVGDKYVAGLAAK